MVRSIKAVFVIVAFLRALEGPLHLTYMAAALVLDSPSATVCVAAVRVWPAGAARARVCKACTARSPGLLSARACCTPMRQSGAHLLTCQRL